VAPSVIKANLKMSGSICLLQQVSSCMHKSSLYHYITPTGKFKSAAIIQLDKEIGQELSKVLLLFQVSKIETSVAVFLSHFL
jgi:hypothetical protein